MKQKTGVLLLLLQHSIACTLLAACSTAAKEPTPVSCRNDEECPEGHICATEQGNICVRSILPPRDLFAFEVRENTIVAGAIDFRADIKGTDSFVTPVIESSAKWFRINLCDQVATSDSNSESCSSFGLDPNEKVSTQTRSVRDRLNLLLVKDSELLVTRSVLVANLSLRQSSRIGQSPHIRPQSGNLRFPPEEPTTITPLPNQPLVLAWPSYEDASEYPLLLTLLPPPAETVLEPDEQANQAIVYRQLTLPSLTDPKNSDGNTFTIQTLEECYRQLQGYAIVLGEVDEPIFVGIELRYAAPFPVIDAIQTSDCDLDCPSQTKTLDLGNMIATEQGIIAKTGLNPVDEKVEPFQTTIYNYCEEDIAADRLLRFIITATPFVSAEGEGSADRGLPPLRFQTPEEKKISFKGLTANDIDPQNLEINKPITTLTGDICIPHWQPAKILEVDIWGSAVSLQANSAIETFVCCDSTCLTNKTNSSAECPFAGSITFSGEITKPDNWKEHNCLPLYDPDHPEDQDPSSVSFRRPGAQCNPFDSCNVSLSPGPYKDPNDPNSGAMAYDMRVEPSVGSVFRSQIVPVTVDENTTALTHTLDYRVILRGKVVRSPALCTSIKASLPNKQSSLATDPCAVESAEIIAERIRLPEEEGQTILGPYVYETNTFDKEGNFLLPVNPGVYLVTAFPTLGSQGGPTSIHVLDLRLPSDTVKTSLVKPENGIPSADIGDELLVFEEAQFVTLELAGFDLSTTATPLDVGSWKQLTFDNRNLDLNHPDTCYSSSNEKLGCRVRRLLYKNTDVLINQEQFIRFPLRN